MTYSFSGQQKACAFYINSPCMWQVFLQFPRETVTKIILMKWKKIRKSNNWRILIGFNNNKKSHRLKEKKNTEREQEQQKQFKKWKKKKKKCWQRQPPGVAASRSRDKFLSAPPTSSNPLREENIFSTLLRIFVSTCIHTYISLCLLLLSIFVYSSFYLSFIDYMSLSTSIHVYIYLCLSIFAYSCIYLSLSIHASIFLSIHASIYLRLSIYVYLSISAYISIYVKPSIYL